MDPLEQYSGPFQPSCLGNHLCYSALSIFLLQWLSSGPLRILFRDCFIVPSFSFCRGGGSLDLFLGVIFAILDSILPPVRAGSMGPRVHEVGPSAPGY